MEVLESLVWHGARPGRLCLQQYFVLWHRRSGVRGIARRDLRSVGIPYQCRLDRGCRRRIRLRPELERQDRVALRRSRERQLHHHRRVERSPVRTGARRRELSLLIATKKHPIASRPLSTAGIFLRPARQDAITRLTALGPLPFLSGSTSNVMRCPSIRSFNPARSTAVMCTNTSRPPSSGLMKPYPRSPLKNLTVPVIAIEQLLPRGCFAAGPHGATAWLDIHTGKDS